MLGRNSTENSSTSGQQINLRALTVKLADNKKYFPRKHDIRKMDTDATILQKETNFAVITLILADKIYFTRKHVCNQVNGYMWKMQKETRSCLPCICFWKYRGYS